jgi:carbamoyltransferase
MIILGIADNHDSGAAVVADGELIAAVNQERIDRVKHSGAFPWGAIDAALDAAGLKPRDVDRIVVGTAFTPSAALRAMPDWHQSRKDDGQFSPLLHAYILYQSGLRRSGLYELEIDACRAILTERLKERRFERAELVMMDHHEAHAHSAFRTQPYDPCLVLTIDAMGDGSSATVWVGRGGDLELRFRQSGLACINTFYSRITQLLGFRPNRHEGKITGLAAYAEPPEELLSHLRRRFTVHKGRFQRMDPLRVDRITSPYWRRIKRWSREEVAAAAQQILEEMVTAFVSHHVEATGIRTVAVAGGVFANVKLNQRIAELPMVDHLWVTPHMGDGGLAAGGALGSAGTRPQTLSSAYLGPSFGRRDLSKALERGKHPREDAACTTTLDGFPGDVERVAAVLASGGSVGRFEGSMEWGPRALGHRTVLASAADPAVNTWLNERLDRSEFMPFAPIVRKQDATRWFKGIESAELSARFMTVCFDCTEEFKRLAPAAVHVDGTARPQLLSPSDDPALHSLLDRMEQLTGAPVLINTSFNLHEEPIVCTPSDAVRAFDEAKLDALWMGPYVVTRPKFGTWSAPQ